ncbi:hypothetical protein [Sorangium sp. So ce861]|uniref:hypothetical protein n=1 Tax=Sorangium sp. So ce861 TaxID=3133323 RepID=UPI003F5F37A0
MATSPAGAAVRGRERLDFVRRVCVAPAGAAVTIDGEPVELEDGRFVPVLPGRHVVRASSNGRTAEAEVEGARRRLRRAARRRAGGRPARTARAACAGPAAPTCTDGVKNGGERGVDCGGECDAECPD